MLTSKNPWWKDNRRKIFTGFAFLLFIFIELRLFNMQLLDRPSFLQKAKANRIRAVSIEPTRGGIFDKQGRLLVENRPSYTLYATPWTVKRKPGTITLLSNLFITISAISLTFILFPVAMLMGPSKGFSMI